MHAALVRQLQHEEGPRAPPRAVVPGVAGPRVQRVQPQPNGLFHVPILLVRNVLSLGVQVRPAGTTTPTRARKPLSSHPLLGCRWCGACCVSCCPGACVVPQCRCCARCSGRRCRPRRRRRRSSRRSSRLWTAPSAPPSASAPTAKRSPPPTASTSSCWCTSTRRSIRFAVASLTPPPTDV
jgi:hypothetical protein